MTVRYIQKQLEEADVILINKTDKLSAEEVTSLIVCCEDKWPWARVLTVSAKTGQGLPDWLNIMESLIGAGCHIAKVDYDVYAEGEAVLGWLNLKATLTSDEPDWNGYAEKLLNALGSRFDALNLPVGHVKLLVRSGEQQAVGNLTGELNTLSLRGKAGSEREAALILNARVQTSPEELQSLVMREIHPVNGGKKFRLDSVNCLSPGRPNPTHRFERIVKPD